MHATNARHCGTCICESSCETKTIRDCKVLWNVSASIVKGPKNTQSYSLHGFWKGSSQDIKCQKKLFIWSITNVDTKDWFWKYEIAFFCVYYPRCTLLLLFSYKAQYFISIISIITYRTTGISASFLKIPNWCFSNCI